MEDDDSKNTEKNRCDEENKLETGVESITITPQKISQAENPVREITQTDHLNKKLLGAFLEKINEKGDNLDGNETLTNSDDWESDTKH